MCTTVDSSPLDISMSSSLSRELTSSVKIEEDLSELLELRDTIQEMIDEVEDQVCLRARLDCLTKPSDISHLTKSG